MQIQVYRNAIQGWETIEITSRVRLVMDDDRYAFQLTEVARRNLRILLSNVRSYHLATLPESSNHIILMPVDSAKDVP